MKKSTQVINAVASRQYDVFEKCRIPNFYDKYKSEEFGTWPFFRTINSNEGPEVTMEGRTVIMFGSNNYLGLTNNRYVKNAALRAIKKYGTSTCGSRCLTGTLDIHLEFEEKLANFMDKEACLLFSTGYQTSQGVIQPLVGRGDYILTDKDNHASIVTAGLMAKGMNTTVVRFKHNNAGDLAKQIENIPQTANKLIVVDGVFSTNGTIVNLNEFYEIADYHNIPIIVDDSHGFGVIGDGGRGTASHFNLQNEIPITFSALSKTLAGIGGFVVGNKSEIDYLRHFSPALVFSASPSPANTAASSAALDVLIKQPELVNQLQQNARFLRTHLQELGYQVPDGETAIIPITLPLELGLKLWSELYERNIFVTAFIPPAAHAGECIMRNSVMASHEPKHLDYLIETYKYLGKKIGII